MKAVEAEREAKKAEKELEEKLKAGKIQWYMDGLEYDCGAGLERNISSDQIGAALDTLKSIKISSIYFGERTEEAEIILRNAIIQTECAYTEQVDWEERQAEAARIKAEQEAEAKRLEEERAKMEAERKAQEEATRKKAEEEAEKLRLAREEIEREKAALEAERLAEAERKSAIEQYALDHEEAISMHEEYKANLNAEIDQARADAMERWKLTEKAKAESEKRKKLIAPDKKALAKVAKKLENSLSEFDIPNLKTEEAKRLLLDCVAGLRAEIHGFELGIDELE